MGDLKNKYSQQFFHYVKPSGAGIMIIGPVLSASPCSTPYSCKALALELYPTRKVFHK
jgi:hypothetical protein